MANLYLRLVLTNNFLVEAGAPWVDAHGVTLPAHIGAIFYRAESTSSYTEKDEETGDVVEIVDVTPPHYEVWGKPVKGGDWEKAGETLCRRVPSTSVLYAEEIWPLDQAARIVSERLSSLEDSEEADDDDDEGGDPTAPDPYAPPVEELPPLTPMVPEGGVQS
jgi:hypothetical protein